MHLGGWGCWSAERLSGRNPETACRILLIALIGSIVAACVAPPRDDFANLQALEAPFPTIARNTGQEGEPPALVSHHGHPVPILASIIVPKQPLQCVPFARQHSRVQIRGDARTWWQQARGRYTGRTDPRSAPCW